jgi:hypothetical protein
MNDVPTSRWTQPHPDYSDGRKFFCGASSQIRDDIGIWWAATWSHFRKLFEVVFVTGDTVMSILAGWSLRYRCCEAARFSSEYRPELMPRRASSSIFVAPETCPSEKS